MQKNAKYSTLKQVERNSLLLKCGLCIATPLQRVRYGKEGKKNNLIAETHGRHQVIKSTSTVTSHAARPQPWHDVMGMVALG